MSTAAALAAEQLYRVVDFCAARVWNGNMESEIDECSLAPLSFGYGLTALRYDGMKRRLCGAAAGSTKILLAAPVSAGVQGNFAKAGLKVGYQLLKFVGRVQKKKFVGEVSS